MTDRAIANTKMKNMGLLDFLGPLKLTIIGGAWFTLIALTILLPVVSWWFTIPAMVVLGIIQGFLLVKGRKAEKTIPSGCRFDEGKLICPKK